MRFSLRNKIIISTILFIDFVFIIIYFVINPAVQDILNIKNKIQEQRIELERKYLFGRDLKKVLPKIKKVMSQLPTLDQVFIDKNNSLAFIETLERAANKNQITVKIDMSSDNNFYNNIPFQLYNNIPIQLFINGKFTDLLKYLKDLESLQYYINIKSLNIVFKDKNLEDQAQMLLTAETHWK